LVVAPAAAAGLAVVTSTISRGPVAKVGELLCVTHEVSPGRSIGTEIIDVNVARPLHAMQRWCNPAPT